MGRVAQAVQACGHVLLFQRKAERREERQNRNHHRQQLGKPEPGSDHGSQDDQWDGEHRRVVTRSLEQVCFRRAPGDDVLACLPASEDALRMLDCRRVASEEYRDRFKETDPVLALIGPFFHALPEGDCDLDLVRAQASRFVGRGTCQPARTPSNQLVGLAGPDRSQEKELHCPHGVRVRRIATGLSRDERVSREF